MLSVFICRTCHHYIEACEPWAAHSLEKDATIVFGNSINPHLVLMHPQYWDASGAAEVGFTIKGMEGLRDTTLPAIRAFLEAHREHDVCYDSTDILFEAEPDGIFTWADMSPWADPLPRHFVEIMGLREWWQVAEFCDAWTQGPPWWWNFLDSNDLARNAFERLVGQQADV